MNIYQVLEKDHKKLNSLLDRLVETSKNDQNQWKKLVDQIRDELIPHSRAEESVFYNVIRELDPGNKATLHSYSEHAKSEADLRVLQTMKAIDVNWTRMTKQLRKDLHHHIKEEESRVFSAARKLFTEEEATMIGSAFKALKPIVKEQSLIGTTLDLITNLLPRRLVPGFKRSHFKDEKRSA